MSEKSSQYPFDSPDNKPDPRSTAMRMEDETDRSPEFKTARNLFVADVNGWLSRLAAVRDQGGTVLVRTPAGTFEVPFLDEPRRVSTDLGRVGHNMRSMATETSSGVWLGGDGQTQPYRLQASIPHTEVAVKKYVEVQGTDPTSALVYGDDFSSNRHSETVAKVTIEYTDDAGQQQQHGYSVTGSGSMGASSMGVDGMPVSSRIHTEDQVAAARQAFSDGVTSSFNIEV